MISSPFKLCLAGELLTKEGDNCKGCQTIANCQDRSISQSLSPLLFVFVITFYAIDLFIFAHPLIKEVEKCQRSLFAFWTWFEVCLGNAGTTLIVAQFALSINLSLSKRRRIIKGSIAESSSAGGSKTHTSQFMWTKLTDSDLQIQNPFFFDTGNCEQQIDAN